MYCRMPTCQLVCVLRSQADVYWKKYVAVDDIVYIEGESQYLEMV